MNLFLIMLRVCNSNLNSNLRVSSFHTLTDLDLTPSYELEGIKEVQRVR